MASSDYYLCDGCGCKVFYDADLSYDDDNHNPRTYHSWPDGVGYMIVLCPRCAKIYGDDIDAALAGGGKGEDRAES